MSNDRQDQRDIEMDALLREAFPAAPSLSEEFEDRVLGKARRAKHRGSSRARSFIMAVYWGAASLVSVWLLSARLGNATGQLPEGIGMLIAALAITALGVLPITRLAGIRLSELFAGTLGGGDEVMD